MTQVLRPVAALLLSVAILLTGQGLQGTLLPVRAALEDFATLSIGAMGAAYFLGFTMGSLKGGELIARVGHVRVFLAMAALASSAPLLHGLILEPVAWALLRMLTGFCFAVLYVVIESWLNERSTNENRGAVFATYVMITLSVIAAGQMMTLLYDPRDLQLFAIASVLVSLAALPVALSRSPSPAQPETDRQDLRRLYRISPAGMIGCLGCGLANGAFWALAPVFTAGVSASASLAAWFMTSAVIGGALLQWPLGYLSDRYGRREVLVVVAATGALIALAIVALHDQLGFVGINLLGGAWGATAFPIYAISVAHSNDHAAPSEYVMVSSGLLLVYGVGAIAGPFLASAVMTATSAAGLYAYTGVVHLLLMGFVILRAFRRADTAPAEQVPFGDSLTAAVTASVVYEEELKQLAEEDA